MEPQKILVEDIIIGGEFVDLEIVDDDGNPLPNKEFTIVLPDGSERQVRTDENGYVRINVAVEEFEIRFSDEEFYISTIEDKRILSHIEAEEQEEAG